MKPGSTITWMQYPTRVDARNHIRGRERTGRVWDDAPVIGHVWVVPDEREDGEGHCILVRYLATGATSGLHKVIEDSAEYEQPAQACQPLRDRERGAAFDGPFEDAGQLPLIEISQ